MDQLDGKRPHRSRGRIPSQDWQHNVDGEQVLALAGAVRFDFLDVPALIRGAEAVYQYPMVDRDPLPTWDFGKVTQKPLALVEQRAPNGFAKLEDVISPHELTQIAEAYKREAGFDVEMLNNRPSLSVS